MSTMIVTSLELSLDIARAKKAAKSGPVVITDRGKPAHVLLSIEYYRRLTGEQRSLVEALSMAELSDIDLKVPRLRIGIAATDLP